MGLARNIAIFTISISLITFIAFFGRLPAFRNTPIGFLHRLIVVWIPSFFRRLDIRFTNGRITNGSSRLGNYLMHEKHPLVIIFFLGLITGSVLLFVPPSWSSLPTKHHVLILSLVPLPYLFTYLSATRNSQSYITASNHAEQMRYYPYDRMLYYPGYHCRTCQFLKPARSKHCSICKTCVARADHHCIWVNNCLGRGNYKWFLAVLLSTGILLAYGAYLAYLVLAPLVRAHYERYEHFYRYDGPNPSTFTESFSKKLHDYLIYISIALDVGGLRISGVGMLALLTWPMPFGLLGYHIYLIWAGMTTNESAKWADWRDDMYDGVVFRGLRKEQGDEQYLNPDEEPPTSWPLESRHLLIRTESGQPPQNLPSRLQRVAQEGSWTRCWSLVDVENVYDLGFWDNLMEALR